MNKYIIVGIVLVAILGIGIGYRTFLLPETSVPVTTGKVREITVTSQADKWNFNPEIIEADRGDKIILTVINEDNYDHGISIDAFGVSQRMPANGTIKIEFVVTQEGDFPFYCSVPCGEGEVDGKKRGHFDMVGKIHVKSIVSSTE
ncbi:MAG: cupredoxin domain-containing protein [bacterium]|nr:cupredoxin domain-containing protein [bacterium]